MSFIFTLMIIMLVITIFSLKYNRFIFSPDICFIGGFLLQTMFGLYYKIYYNIDVSSKTFFVIVEGTIVFLFTSKFIVQKMYGKNLLYNKLTLGVKPIYIVKSKLLFFVFIQLICLCGYVWFMTSKYGKDIAVALYTYRHVTADLGEVVNIPFFLSFLRGFSSVIGYILSYALACNLANRYFKDFVLLIINIVLSLLNESMLGARGGVISFVIGIIIEIELVKYKNTGRVFSVKLFLKYLLIAVGIIALFPVFGTMIGRPSLGVITEFVVYLGAPLINLDLYINNSIDLYTKHFNSIGVGIKDIERICHISLNMTEYASYNKWNYIKGNTLGNVYTIFAPFWHDGKYVGVIIYSAIMAYICCLVYRKALKVKFDYKIDISVILYAYLVGPIIFAFFSNKFYDVFFSLYTIKFMVCLLLVKFYIEKIRIIK